MSRSGPQVSTNLARPPDYTDHLKQNLEAVFLNLDALEPVSYTHLTLPTICSV